MPRIKIAGLLAGTAGLLMLLLAACGSDPTATPVPTSTPTAEPGAPPTATPTPKAAWEIEWDELVEAAHAEGTLVWAGGAAIKEDYGPLSDAFSAKFGIQVIPQSGSSSQAQDRILAERQANLFTTDILSMSPRRGKIMIENGALDPIPPQLFLPEVLDESLWWDGQHQYGDLTRQYIFQVSSSVRGANFTINTDLVNEDDINSYWDLLDPKYSDLLVSGFIGEEGVGSSVVTWYLLPGMGPELLEKLILETNIEMVGDLTVGKNWLITGKKGIGLFLGGIDDMVALAALGAPIKVVTKTLKEGGIIQGGGSSSVIMLMNKAPHPNAAKLFLNWYLSREGQTAMVTAYPQRQSFREDVPTDMIPPELVREEGKSYLYPPGNPAFIAGDDEARAFVAGLVQKYRDKKAAE